MFLREATPSKLFASILKRGLVKNRANRKSQLSPLYKMVGKELLPLYKMVEIYQVNRVHIDE